MLPARAGREQQREVCARCAGADLSLENGGTATVLSIRDNGPDVMIDDEGNTLAVNMRWSNYSNNDKMEPAQQLARRAARTWPSTLTFSTW